MNLDDFRRLRDNPPRPNAFTSGLAATAVAHAGAQVARLRNLSVLAGGLVVALVVVGFSLVNNSLDNTESPANSTISIQASPPSSNATTGSQPTSAAPPEQSATSQPGTSATTPGAPAAPPYPAPPPAPAPPAPAPIPPATQPPPRTAAPTSGVPDPSPPIPSIPASTGSEPAPTSTGSAQPSATPSPSPSASSSDTPSPSATPSPSPSVSSSDTPSPTATPSPSPSATPGPTGPQSPITPVVIPRCQSSDITVLETNVWLDDEDGTARGELVLGSTRAEDCRLTGTLTAMLQATGLPTIHFPEQEVDTVLIGRGSLTITIRYQVSGRCVDPTATLRLAIGQHGPWQLAGYPAECPSEAPR